MNDRKPTQEQADRLREILSEMKNLTDEASTIIRRNAPSITWERARGYCLGHIEGALNRDNSIVGGSMFTLEDIIDEFESSVNSEEEENEENK